MTAAQLLAVLMTGATVEFPNNYKVTGDPANKYIETYENGDYTGLLELNEKGAEECLKEWKGLDEALKGMRELGRMG
jgi:hypothetical protein